MPLFYRVVTKQMSSYPRKGERVDDVLKHQQYGDVLYGPFDGVKEAQRDAQQRFTPDVKKDRQILLFDGELHDILPHPKELPEDQKRAPGDEKNWRQVKEGEWRCKTCDAVILAGKVAHPIWVRGFAGGGGECKYEEVGYCPNCEKQPDFHGAPVYED